jgi:hypothetical protein
LSLAVVVAGQVMAVVVVQVGCAVLLPQQAVVDH